MSIHMYYRSHNIYKLLCYVRKWFAYTWHYSTFFPLRRLLCRLISLAQSHIRYNNNNIVLSRFNNYESADHRTLCKRMLYRKYSDRHAAKQRMRHQTIKIMVYNNWVHYRVRIEFLLLLTYLSRYSPL